MLQLGPRLSVGPGLAVLSALNTSPCVETTTIAGYLPRCLPHWGDPRDTPALLAGFPTKIRGPTASLTPGGLAALRTDHFAVSVPGSESRINQ